MTNLLIIFITTILGLNFPKIDSILIGYLKLNHKYITAYLLLCYF
jgi:hypothetical protein